MSFHLRYGFVRDRDNAIYMAPKKYINKRIDGYRNMFEEIPLTKFKSPIEKKEHPELDVS